MAKVEPTAVDTSKTVLLTLGRLPVALEIARAFHARGWRVIVAETMGWHQCRLSNCVAACHVVISPVLDHRRYKQQLLDVISKEQVTLVVPVSEEILYVSRIADLLPPGVTLLAMNSSALDQLHDKWLFARWAMDNEFPVPATALGGSDAAQQLIDEHPYVVKPRLSCSGVGVVFGERGAIPEPELFNDEHVVQLKLSDKRCSSFVMSSHGKCMVIVTYRSLLDSGSVAVRFERIATPIEIKEFNEAAVLALSFTGMISFDFMEDRNGQWRAIECNPRATSGLHLVSPQQIVACFLAMETPALADRIAEPFSNYAAPKDVSVLPEGACRQEFWSALTETERQLFTGSLSVSKWKQLFRTTDISWSKQDWKPCVLMPFATWQLLWLAARQRKPISQVAMLDVGWYHALSDQSDGLNFPVVSISTEVPEGYEELLADVTFGTDGLRYQRRNIVEQIERFDEPVFISSHIQEELVGIYVLDKRQLVIGEQVVTGFYRGVLAVAEQWQGRRVGQGLTDAAMTWLDKQAVLLNQPVLSYGCIDASNTRSVALLEKQGASCIGNLSMFMMYRQWPRSKTELVEIGDQAETTARLTACHSDYLLQDITPPASPALAFVDEEGVRISAGVSVSEFCIVEMGFWPRWITRILVKPWPPARKRFDPAHFRSVVFSRITVRPGCEDDWPDFVSAVLARFAVHFGTVYSDPTSDQFNELLRVGKLNQWLHSATGSIQIMAKVHDASDASDVADMQAADEEYLVSAVPTQGHLVEVDSLAKVADESKEAAAVTPVSSSVEGVETSPESLSFDLAISSEGPHALFPVDS